MSSEYAYTVEKGGGFPLFQLLCNLWKWNVALSRVLTINLISRCCIPEAFDDVVRVKSTRNFKLSSFYPNLSVSLRVDLIKFRTS